MGREALDARRRTVASMTAFTERAREILDHPEIATVATIQPDGSPQLSPVWIKRDGDDLLFSTTAGRRKPANLARDPRITVLVWPSYSPYEYVEVRGTAAGMFATP